MDGKKLRVSFPMIDMSAFQRPSSWCDFSSQIMSQRFGQFVQSNRREEHYIQFLNDAAFKIPAVAKKPPPKTPFGLLLRKADDPLEEDGSLRVTAESDDRKRVSKVCKSVSRLLEFSEFRLKRSKQYNIVWNQVGRKTQRSRSAVARLKPRGTESVEEMGVLTEPKRLELFLFRNLSPSCLMNLVLRTLVAHFEVDCEARVRRKSSELHIEGGRIAKGDLWLHTPDPLEAIRDLFLKLALSKEEPKKPAALPWFLDNNPQTLASSLEGLKGILLRFACSSEKVVYNLQDILASSKKPLLVAPAEDEETTSILQRSEKASDRKSKKASVQKDIVEQYGVDEDVLNMDKVKDIILISIDFKIPPQPKPAAAQPQSQASDPSLKVPLEAVFRSKSPSNDQTAHLNMRELMNAKYRMSYNVTPPVRVAVPKAFESAGEVPELVLNKSRRPVTKKSRSGKRGSRPSRRTGCTNTWKTSSTSNSRTGSSPIRSKGEPRSSSI